MTHSNDRSSKTPFRVVASTGESDPVPSPPIDCSAADLKEYIADILLELHDLAEQSGLRGLAGRIASAYLEARHGRLGR